MPHSQPHSRLAVVLQRYLHPRPLRQRPMRDTPDLRPRLAPVFRRLHHKTRVRRRPHPHPEHHLRIHRPRQIERPAKHQPHLRIRRYHLHRILGGQQAFVRRVRPRHPHPRPRRIQPVVRQVPALKPIVKRQRQYAPRVFAHRYLIHKPPVIHRRPVRHRPEPNPQIRLLPPFRQIHRMLRPRAPPTRRQPVDPRPRRPIRRHFHIRIIHRPQLVPVPELQHRPYAPVQIHRRLRRPVHPVRIIPPRRIVQTHRPAMSNQRFPSPSPGKGPFLHAPFHGVGERHGMDQRPRRYGRRGVKGIGAIRVYRVDPVIIDRVHLEPRVHQGRGGAVGDLCHQNRVDADIGIRRPMDGIVIEHRIG